MKRTYENPGGASAGVINLSRSKRSADRSIHSTEHLAKAIEGVAVEVVSFGDFFSDDERARAFRIGSIAARGGVPVTDDLAFLGNAYSRMLRVGGVE